MAKFGNAAILWTSTEDANTSRVFLLDQPLVEVTPHHNQAVYRRESLDRSAVETYSVGSGAYELTGTIRYSADPDGLVEMLKAGSQGKTLTYIPNLNDMALQNNVILMDPMSPTQATLDAQRGGYAEHQVSVRFRKTDESPFTGQVKGTDVIFAYRAGGSLKHGVATASFARVTSTSAPASYASISTGDLGFGTISTAATNKARVSWMANPTSLGPRTFPVTLLEPARTNRLPESEDFSAWTQSGAVTLTTGQTDPMGGSRATLIADNLTTGSASVYYPLSPSDFLSTFAVYSLFVRQGTTVSTAGSRLSIANSTGGNLSAVDLTWSSGLPVTSVVVGALAGPVERWRGGWYRVALRPTGALTTGIGGTIRFFINPAIGSATDRGDIYAYGGQVEQ
jgi:hypothetical protein